MLDRAVEAYGRLDVLHNNAFGVPPTLQGRRMARVAELDQGVWDYTLQVGLTAVMQATRSALPIMLRQGGGAIVNTASISGLFGDYGIAAYNAMKAGVANFTRVVAMEYAGAQYPLQLHLPRRDRHAAAAPIARHDPGFFAGDRRGHSDGTAGPPGGDGERRHVPGLRPGVLCHRRGIRGGWRADGEDRHSDAVHRLIGR